MKKTDSMLLLDRYNFPIDTNNLVSEEMVERIFHKIPTPVVKRLNDFLGGIKFYIGGNHRHNGDKDYISLSTFEFDLKNRRILFFLFKIFDKGYRQWKDSQYGSLKRFLWESFFHEILVCLTTIIRIDKKLILDFEKIIREQKKSSYGEELFQLFTSDEESIPKLNFITFSTELWRENLPQDLGFLNIFHSRKLNELKKNNAKGTISYFLKNKYFNELRKVKLNYEYEYNLSELINHCIYSDHFKPFLNDYSSDNVRRKLYYKGKRVINKFLKKYNIETKNYKDSAGRNHTFISHNIFEKIKSVCLQLCIKEIRTDALKKYKKFKEFYSKCPICGRDEINQVICEKVYFSLEYQSFKKVLLGFLESGGSLDTTNNQEQFFGVPCEDCFYLIRNIQGEFSDFNFLQKFILQYSECPVCSGKNHLSYLLSFFYDSTKEDLKEVLIEHMEGKNVKKVKLNIGIPCCECYEQVFGEFPEYLDSSFN